MSTRTQATTAFQAEAGTSGRRAFRLAPVAQALALLLMAGGVVDSAQAGPAAFSSGWFGAMGTTQSQMRSSGMTPTGALAGIPTSAMQQQQSQQQLQQSLNNLNRTAAAIAAQQAAQAAARLAAMNAPSAVPDGLADGGLKIDTNALTKGWLNANAPTQSTSNGKTTVAIQQTADKAILNWETFNVGKNTTVQFGQQADWAVLNRVNDPSAKPSQIQGQIKGAGTVMVMNRNGVIFSGSSQVNVRNLVAAAANMSDAQFTKNGIYSLPANGTYNPSLTDALGAVEVQPGASLNTVAPTSVTQGGGYVLLAGAQVSNAGAITTPQGQATLAAGDDFLIRSGVSTSLNTFSTTRGNEVIGTHDTNSTSGAVSNTGLIQSPEGDITLTGHQVLQDGVALSTTTVNNRGTIHLSNSAADAQGSVTLGSNSITAILLDESGGTALDSQRAALILDSAKQDQQRRVAAADAFSNTSKLDDRRDLSRIEIVSGSTAQFADGSITLATGGQVAASTVGRSTVGKGALVDVSGAVGVQVAMESNNVKINVQGNEQRDAPGARDAKNLNNSDVWVDRRSLIHVAAGVGGDANERWYTDGGLLEVGGYLDLAGHSVGEWAAQGGIVTFSGGEVVTQKGSSINLSGGTYDVQSGYIRMSWIRGTDGRLYDISNAPGDLNYQGLYKGYEDAHTRWGDTATRYFYNPLIAPRQRYEDGYTVGRDAGRLVVSTTSAVLEGDAVSDTYQGPRQTDKASSDWDGYTQSQDAAARGAQLILGKYQTAFNTDPKNGSLGVFFNLTSAQQKIEFGEPDALADSLLTPAADASSNGNTNTNTNVNTNSSNTPLTPLPDDRQGTAYVDSALVNHWNLGGILAAANESVTVNNALQVVPGGTIQLYAPYVNVNANLTAHGGTIALGNALQTVTAAGTRTWTAFLPIATVDNPHPDPASTTVGQGVLLDASGLWSNLLSDPQDHSLLPYQDGGAITIRNTGDVTLAQGSVLDVSSGAALLQDNTLHGGKGGDVTLAAAFLLDGNSSVQAVAGGLLTLGGELRAYGVAGGGALNIESGAAIGIGGQVMDTDGLLQAGQAAPANLRLLQDYQLAVGDRAPMDISLMLNLRPPGYTFTIATSSFASTSNPLFVAKDWRIPAVFSGPFTDINGHSYAVGDTIPANTVIVRSAFWPANFTVPGDVFPKGAPVADYPVIYQAGDVMVSPLTLPSGSILLAGAVLTRPAAVGATGTLDPALFHGGFAQYTVTGQNGIVIAPGTQVDVSMPVLRADLDAARALATGGSLTGRLPVWTPPLYQEDADSATLAQRGGASITLQAGSKVAANVASAPLIMGTGANIAVDPGQAITLWSNGGQLTVDGQLDAWGGSISIASLPLVEASYRASTSRSVWIGDNAVLDAAARAYVAHDAQGRAYGIAPDGGSINIGMSDSFIVIRPGALLDASGASAQVDASAGGQPTVPSQALQLAGAGGNIELHSYVGMNIDGTLSAHAGGAGAAGGSLTVEMANRVYRATQEPILDAFQVSHDLTLTQQHQPSDLPADLAPGQKDPALKYGRAVLGVDQVQAGGFDALTLATHDMFIFDGDINLSLGRSLNLRNGILTVADTTPDAQVHLAAPYIRMDGGVWAGRDGVYSPGIFQVTSGKSARGDSALTLTANLIDLYGALQSGIVGLRGDGPIGLPSGFNSGATNRLPVDADGFATVALQSQGDVRLNNASLAVTGDLSIEAAQIYPSSGQRGTLTAGLVTDGTTGRVGWDLDSSLVIRSNGQPAPLPDSVFGRLLLAAPTLDQGGIVRAPLGAISLNDMAGWGASVGDMRLILRAGSVTSVSAAGLLMPYGGTADGLTYRGADGTLFNLAGNFVSNIKNGDGTQADNYALPQGISLGGGSVVAEAGSVLDLSGGGDLRGAGFISGRGGSVDVLTTPLANANPAANHFSGAGNKVYAILPGYASNYAPLVADKGAGDPAVGRQITIGAGVPGLPAGTYTLLPASFALMPGAYRVEVGQHASPMTATAPAAAPGASTLGLLGGVHGNRSAASKTAAAVSMPNGSWSTMGTLGTAGTGQRDTLPSQVLVTPGQVVRQYSQYNEMSYAEFAVTQAALFGNVRPMLPVDGKVLRFNFSQNDKVVPLQFDGLANLDAAQGGIRGQVSVQGSAPIDIVGGTVQPTVGAIAISADTLSAFNASTLSIGGLYSYFNGTGSGESSRVYFSNGLTGGPDVNVRDGATLRAGQIFLISNQINVDGGAVLDTRGMGSPGVDSTMGYLYANNRTAADAPYSPAVLAVSNGWLDFLPSAGPGHIAVKDGASLLTEGTIAFAAPAGLDVGDVNLGARFLTVSQDQINIGTSAGLAAAQATGSMQIGWQLTQETLDRLLRPSSTAGVPALERLSLTAGGAFNFYGSVSLDTGDSSAQMVFNTPAFYGLGDAGDEVRIASREFVWNGLTTGDGSPTAPYATVAPVAVQTGGPGTGSGRLVIDAQSVLFGYDDLGRPQRQAELGRLALGFASVQINASDRISANSKGVLSVAQSQDADGALHGGTLSLITPLLTGQGGSVMRYVAGGAINVSAPQGVAPADAAAIAAIGELGGSVTLQGASVALDTAVALPGGVLKVVADGDITLGDGAQIDLSGRAVTFFDITKYSWGGNVDLESTGGNIAQAAGSRIDVSASNNDAGALTVNAGAGAVTLAGTLAGTGATGFKGGQFSMTTAHVDSGDFTALNQHLNDAGFLAARSFDIRQGDLTVGDGVRAHDVNITTDAGNLTVNGTIDASGDGPGNITLAAGGNLTLTGHAVLDAHGKTLVVDSYGAPIDASNRAKISLASTSGTVRLDTGAVMDLSSPDNVARGQVEINAPRVGNTAASATGANAPLNATGNDIAIMAAGPLDIRGARSIALNGFARYTNAPADPADTNGQIITQDYLNKIDQDSQVFDAAARNNPTLQAHTAGLSAYGAAYHLRPGVEVDSATPDGNLTVSNDLDLSGYRYGPNANRDLASALYGAGEPMALVIRAGGDLTINGSINDGFAPPPATPDDNGWLLHQTVLLTGQATTQDITVSLPFDPVFADVYYVFPSFNLGDGYPVVVSGSISDDTATYNPGDSIPGYLYGTVTVTAGTVLTSTIPNGADILLNGPRPEPGRMWQMSQMLAPGSLSASIRLVSGADLQAADTRALQAAGQLGGRGNMVLDDLHNAAATQSVPMQAISVVRTGTGDLDLYVGGNYQQNSQFGVYTAGTSVAGTGPDSGYNAPRAQAKSTDTSVLGAANSAYESTLPAQRLWFTEDGGDFTLSAQGDITGYLQPETLSVGDWLWRQGGAELGQRTAWGLNFGSYVVKNSQGGAQSLGQAGYAGVGALGGGNATIHAGGNIGVAGDVTSGLMAAVGGSGRVTDDGVLIQTGGGALTVTAGGQVSGGMYANLRGDTTMAAGDVGSLTLNNYATPNSQDPRAVDPHTAYGATRGNAVNFAPGDGALRVDTLGDMAVGVVVDPGRVGEGSETQASSGAFKGSAATWFTLWTDRTAVNLFSAGGNASPFGDLSLNPSTFVPDVGSVSLVLPATVSAVAAGGSIYYTGTQYADSMMPSPQGHLDLLARGLISADLVNGSQGSFSIGPLGTSPSAMTTPLHAAWRIANDKNVLVTSNYWDNAALPKDFVLPYEYAYQAPFSQNEGRGGTLFMFGPNTVTDQSADGTGVQSHVYAVNGDIMSVQIGAAMVAGNFAGSSAPTYYQGSKPLRIVAGGDIVNTSGLIVQGAATDVSMVAAAGDILYTNFSIAGPGTLEVSAGGQIYQGSKSSLTSVGPVAVGDTRPGADIVVQAGLGAGVPGAGTAAYDAFARLYLDVANLADPGQPLADQAGKVVKTYDAELAQWLGERYGYAGKGGADALAYFLALPAEQQRVFVRQVYYAELLAGGREYNDEASKRFNSYLRGREAIAALFPDADTQGNAIERSGDLTLFQGATNNAGIRTIAGGSIQTLTPGGQTIVGVEGVTPAQSAGVLIANPTGLITQGFGNIQMYSQGSVLLGLSRIMTTFGGNIQAWSAEGDINAGRGSKTTLVYTPPKLVYDNYGNTTISPNVPSSGAGIATLNPIPEVLPGDVDLIAPLGTIDAGEAGIRVSGNVNIAALHIVNAANIQVQGKSTGIPVVASVNTSALTSASAAASSAANAAQDVTRQQQAAARQALPSIITVQVLGFGSEQLPGTSGAPSPGSNAPANAPATRSQQPVSYDFNGPVQVLGQGELSGQQLGRLTDTEQRNLAKM